jgi:2-dehydro-3-deoxy-D-arabinonate dehydratase
MKLFRTTTGIFLEHESQSFLLPTNNWDELVRSENLQQQMQSHLGTAKAHTGDRGQLLAPIGTQGVWAAGVTYLRSRSARIEESQGGGDFYDRVYDAQRPELFFKSLAHRVVPPGGGVRIRTDATWSVPEPELTLLINPVGRIIGYTIGNDMSSRDIEGENPLYLPQAKVYNGSCALGPAVLLASEPIDKSTSITLEIARGGKTAFTGTTRLTEMRRDPAELAEYLFRELTFNDGAYLMTGTGIVPADDFTLAAGDRIRISIDGIGTLENVVL